MFQTIPSQQIKAPSLQEGVEIELPDFDELFKRIQLASPLAKIAIEQAAKPENDAATKLHRLPQAVGPKRNHHLRQKNVKAQKVA